MKFKDVKKGMRVKCKCPLGDDNKRGMCGVVINLSTGFNNQVQVKFDQPIIMYDDPYRTWWLCPRNIDKLMMVKVLR